MLTIKEKDPAINGKPANVVPNINVEKISLIPIQPIKDPNLNDEINQHAQIL